MVSVLPSKAGLPEEPNAPNLIGSLIHPDHSAGLSKVAFSPDGSRLFASGYPSGIVQIWDVASRREIVRIDTPPGLRGTDDYALLTPDWKTLYVPIEKSSDTRIERDGKTLTQINYSGQIRVWDLTSGKEKEPLGSDNRKAPIFARLAPGGRHLMSIERVGCVVGEPNPPDDATVLWDLSTRTKREVNDEYDWTVFATDVKTAITAHGRRNKKAPFLTLIDIGSRKEIARLECPYKDRHFALGQMSPDGSIAAMQVGGKVNSPVEVWFLDARTLELRGKLVDDADPDGYAWRPGQFTPDGKRFILSGAAGKVHVWNVAEQKLERKLTFGVDRISWNLAISLDSRTLAVSWMPRSPIESSDSLELDPLDYPQPRVSLVNLDGKSPPRVLMAPHGGVGSLAFSPDGKLLAFGSSGAIRLFDLTK